MFSDHFDALISKIIFKKIKKYIILMHFQVKSTLKSNHNHTFTKHFNMLFATHKLQPQFLPNTYLNPTNHTFFELTFFKPQPQKLPKKQTHS
jgi:hypothetical protein